MQTKRYTLGLLCALAAYTQSCTHDTLHDTAPGSTVVTETVNQLQATFAKNLAQAVSKDAALRSFLRTESLKMVDKDNDVVYQLVKDEPIDGGETLRQRLLHYMDESELTSLEQQLPLLTILVPTLPSGFSPQTWDSKGQVPLVAVRKQQNTPSAYKVSFFDEHGTEQLMDAGNIPGFPTLVVKQNERITTEQATSTEKEATRPFLQNQQCSLRFIDNVYDGIHPTSAPLASKASSKAQNKNNLKPSSNPNNTGAAQRTTRAFWFADGDKALNNRIITAWRIEKSNPNTQWQRDYVYYGISPTTDRGRLQSNIKETIRSFRLSNAGIVRMAGQADDPTAPTVGSTSLTNNGAVTAWMDGQYEFLIVVLYNPKDGQPPQTNVRFPVSPAQIYDATYQPGPGFFGRFSYVLTSVTPKQLMLNRMLATWDLENFGTAWSYHVLEENQTMTRTEQQVVTTTYAANFSFEPSFAGIVKLGPKFGASAQTVNQRTVSVQYTTGSTDLGEITHYFYDPILVGETPNDPISYTEYQTFELAPGGTQSNFYLSVEPYNAVELDNQYF